MDLRSDWKVWDNRESITYVVESRAGDTSQSVANCKRRVLSYRELATSGGAYTAGDRVWLVPVEMLPGGVSPKIADRVVDSGSTAWTVLEASLNTWQTWWRLVTRNIVLASGLSESLTFWQPANLQDAAGGRQPQYSLAATVTGRIQEVEGSAEDRLGKRQAVRRFQAWVGQRVYPSMDWQVRDEAGTVYQITGWRSADRWDVLQELDLEIVK